MPAHRSPFAQHRAGAVQYRAAHICHRGVAAAKLFLPAVQSDEGVLDHVLRGGKVIDEQDGQADHLVPTLLVQLLYVHPDAVNRQGTPFHWGDQEWAARTVDRGETHWGRWRLFRRRRDLSLGVRGGT